MFRTVIFDCFGVLYLRSLADFFEQHLPDYDSIKDKLHDLRKQADYGLITEREYFNQVSELTGLSSEELEHGLTNHIRNEKLLSYIKQLGTRYNIGVLSNIGRGAMDRYFSAEEQKELFDAVILSSEVGMVKPHPEIFELAAERLGTDTSECVFVDDMEDNVRGAESVGMKGLHFKDTRQAMQDLVAILGA